MKKTILDLEIIKKQELNAFHYTLTLKAAEKIPVILPGQFAQVLVDKSATTFLRRPISIHDVNIAENTISFYVKCVGPATQRLREYKIGEFLNVMFPLGNTFTLETESPVLLVGGGCGVAPLLYLAKYLHAKNVPLSVLIGARNKNDFSELEEYKKLGNVYLITEDGSEGEKGIVTKHSVFSQINQFKRIYCCGPELMMKAIAKIAKQNNVECEVSLENTMACGIGACLCCVTDTKEGNKCVCTEGPVFNINQLKW